MEWLLILSNILIWLAYMAIPVILVIFLRKRRGTQCNILSWLFAGFILACGFSHGITAFSEFVPVNNLNAVIHAITAIISVVTAVYFSMIVPKVLEVKSPAELKKINEDLEDERARHHAITNTMREAMIIADYNGTILECNRAVEHIFGWNQHELVGKNIIVLIPDSYKDRHLEGIQRFRETGISHIAGKTLDLDGLKKDGTLVPLALSVVIVDVKGTSILCAVIRDVSQRKQDERKIYILNETLKTRVAALEAFQFSVAHDLNAPLRSMEGFSQILGEDYKDKLDATAADYIDRIVKSVKKMRHLIEDMLRLSRITQGDIPLKKEDVSLSDIINDILNEHVKSYNPNNRKYIFKVQPELLIVADRELISIAIYNLVSNAWKFSAKKEITEIEFGVIVRDDKLVYYIKDNGVGFDMSKADKLFKPFSRLHDKKDFDGNGVGLSIVKQIITLHDGNVWAEGEVGQGATFFFTIGTKNA